MKMGCWDSVMGCGGGAAALDEVVREGFLEEVSPKLELQGGRQVMIGKGKVRREQHMLRLRGQNEQKAFRKWKKECNGRAWGRGEEGVQRQS